MAKYIIDIPEDRIGDFVGSTCLLMPFTMAKHKGVYNTNLKLTPYTEPDREAIENEVWELVGNINSMTEEELLDVYGIYEARYIDDNYTYQEAKAKYDAWKKSKEEIRVGDEVIPPLYVQYDTMVVTRLWTSEFREEWVDTIAGDGKIYIVFLKEVLKRQAVIFQRSMSC